jgi:hypothetical protein
VDISRRTSTPVQQRMILESVGLNYTLKARNVAFSLDKPFDVITEAGGLSNWSGLVEDVRTLIVQREPNVGRFERALRIRGGMMPDMAEAAYI